MMFWVAIGLLFFFSGFVHRIIFLMFCTGFILMSSYLVYVWIINPGECEGWILTEPMKWYWYCALPFISGCIFAILPTTLLGFAT